MSEEDTASAVVSFQTDILPMFTETDVKHMAPMGVLLNDYQYMSDPSNAESVYEQVSGGQMPPGEPWTDAQVTLFQQWMQGGYQP